MARRRTPLRPASGEGQILYRPAFVGLLKHHGYTPEAFTKLVRSGILRTGFRPAETFEISDETLSRLPSPLPEMEGSITWRRKANAWSMDVKRALLRPGVRYWEMLADGICQIRFSEVTIPEMAVPTLVGQPLSALTDDPYLADASNIIRQISVYRNQNSTEVKFEAPYLSFLDTGSD